MFRRLSTICIVMVAPLAAADDTTYTIKLYQSKAGDVSNETRKMSGDTTFSFTPTGQPEQKQTTKEGEHYQYTETILEKPAGAERATKLTRTYETAEKTERGEMRKLAYQGKTLLIEKGKDKYTFTIDGKPLAAEDAKELDKKFNTPDADRGPANQELMPTKPVKVGDTWAVDTAKAIRSMKADKLYPDEKKFTITGKLLKAYKKNAAQFGTIEIDTNMPLSEGDFGGNKVAFKAGSVMRFKMTIDCCIDGSTPGVSSTADVSMTMLADLPNGALEIRGKNDGIDTVEPVKSK
ncbi:MAG: hypothetical protein ABGY75_01680 [Gemmataceae bacterium]